MPFSAFAKDLLNSQRNEYKPCIPLISCENASGSEYWSFQ